MQRTSRFPRFAAAILIGLLAFVVVGVTSVVAFPGGYQIFISQDGRQIESHDKTRAFGLDSNKNWLLSGGNFTVTGTLTAAGVLTTGQPSADNTTALGASNKRWSALYVGPGGIVNNGPSVPNLVEVSTNYNATGAEGDIGVNTTSAAVGIYLPDVTTLPGGLKLSVFDEGGAFASHNCFIYTHSPQTINGNGSSMTMNTAYGRVNVQSNLGATTWFGH